ncbi:MAG TPA: 2-oxoacid:acceptor oxidoreductase family protein [Acidimicrobiales bacterium]|nr:2-oxoacid:acceptor oxidoreductase family protein [Acidimicrobiales bacterium]
MFEVRLHGRGGQGVVTAAELLSVAAFLDGRRSQAFPSFGSERTGAPVVSFCRIDGAPIRTRAPVSEPDALIIQDATLIHQVDLLGGLKPGGYVLLNTVLPADSDQVAWAGVGLPPGHFVTVPATELAIEHLRRPMPGVALLGAFCALTGVVSLGALAAAARGRFAAAVADGNVGAAQAAFDIVRQRVGTEVAGAPTD